MMIFDKIKNLRREVYPAQKKQILKYKIDQVINNFLLYSKQPSACSNLLNYTQLSLSINR
jgi:hypothetical protein